MKAGPKKLVLQRWRACVVFILWCLWCTHRKRTGFRMPSNSSAVFRSSRLLNLTFRVPHQITSCKSYSVVNKRRRKGRHWFLVLWSYHRSKSQKGQKSLACWAAHLLPSWSAEKWPMMAHLELLMRWLSLCHLHHMGGINLIRSEVIICSSNPFSEKCQVHKAVRIIIDFVLVSVFA